MACPINPADCVGSVIGGAASSAVDQLVKSIADGVESMLSTVSTFWLSVPSPAVDGQAVSLTRLNLEWLVVIFVAAGLLIAMVRMGVHARAGELVNLGRMYLILGLVTGISTIVVSGLLAAGDQMAPWFIQQATDQPFSTSSATLITSAMLTSAGQGAGLLLGLLAMLASVLQIITMLMRGAFIVLLMGVLPALAADTATESGMMRFKRALGWLAAAILYKPVGAVIYSVGFLQMEAGQGAISSATDQTAQALYRVIMGLLIIILAVLALPALMRFVAPITQRAGGGVSTGAAVGTIASGAAVVAGVIATGGAGAPAAGAAAGGAAAGGATAGGATAGGATAGGATAGGDAAGGGGATGGDAGGSPAAGGPAAGGPAAGGGAGSATAGAPATGGAAPAAGGDAAGASPGGGGGGSVAAGANTVAAGASTATQIADDQADGASGAV